MIIWNTIIFRQQKQQKDRKFEIRVFLFLKLDIKAIKCRDNIREMPLFCLNLGQNHIKRI